MLRKVYYMTAKGFLWGTLQKSFSVTPATVEYWMQKYNFKRRSQSESAYVK
jgi:hypothetical protein